MIWVRKDGNMFQVRKKKIEEKWEISQGQIVSFKYVVWVVTFTI